MEAPNPTTNFVFQREGRRRQYHVHQASNTGTIIRIEDTATPYLAYIAREMPHMLRASLRHVAWWLQGTMKKEMRSGAPGGRAVKPLSRIQRSRKLDILKGRNSQRKMQNVGKQFGGLLNAVGYDGKKLKDGIPTVAIGWLSRSAAKWGTIMQAGMVTPAFKTEKIEHTNSGGRKTTIARYSAASERKVRGLWARAGIKLGVAKHVFVSPPRPVMGPIFSARKDEILQRLRDRIGYNIELGKYEAKRASKAA